ncbi:hypothetical protein CC77DRAFT_1067776 [Alternaria alternata]|uniref:Uncharacterized protein n=1 Tax=Alternaria alternata TaxID=5599 RepID=A0A177D1M5_ALTAL|nr:hypothetical protein CC77DRAFT_1067776 [Alternaria alternata]OAG13564.1 hypothetical protein CC77DRAFT_1067776 [Alternaria alternata]RYN62553.1 hypothetical protein AA0118_g5569 [Alternaria tenuissima]
MEGLSVAANGLAIISVAFQLTEACIKLHTFWETVEDAPGEIAAIKEDLRYLISVFKRVESHSNPLGSCLAEGVQHCRAKIADLTLIVERFDNGFQSLSRRKRVRTAFKAALHSKHIQRFRDSLNDAKSTLTLALAHESVIQSLSSRLPTKVKVHDEIERYGTAKAAQRDLLRSTEIDDASGWIAVQSVPSKYVGQRSLRRMKSPNTATLQPLGEMLIKHPSIDYKVQELMLHAIAQTAVTTFESTSMEIFAQDGYTIDACGQLRTKTFVYAENLRYHVNHHVSTFRTALGCAWLRTTTLHHDNKSSKRQRKLQIIRSLILYPTRWLQYMGIQNGLEAVVASGGRSWLFNCNITVTRPVPDDALIFGLCRTGQTRAVEALLEKGMASVVDTSPKGWKPLHFAAAAGHVDLCALLIKGGADKSALVYEGPSDAILSPISLFVSSCTDEHADTKIAMLRLFCECIDIADADSDGWSVHDWLKRAYARERVPISRNSITWLLHLTVNEEYVEFSARNIWSALQHAMRSVSNHARHSNYLEQVLCLSREERSKVSKRHLDALGSWLALRVSGRVLLPMIVNAGSFLQMKGFDWMEDNLTHRQFLQALPSIYSAWCTALLDCIEQVKTYMREELDRFLCELGMAQGAFIRALTRANNLSHNNSSGKLPRTACTHCKDDYGPFACGLVEPARIAVTECVKSGHNANCVCDKVQKAPTISDELPEYTGMLQTDSDNDNDNTHEDDEFFDAQPHVFNDEDLQITPTSSMFTDIATLLYSAQGKMWLGEHSVGERLCSTCLLLKEKYIGKDGLSADFPPMPMSFDGLRVKW